MDQKSPQLPLIEALLEEVSGGFLGIRQVAREVYELARTTEPRVDAGGKLLMAARHFEWSPEDFHKNHEKFGTPGVVIILRALDLGIIGPQEVQSLKTLDFFELVDKIRVHAPDFKLRNVRS